MTVKKVKVTLNLKGTLMENILWYVEDIKDHINRCEELINVDNCVDDTDIDDFIKWFNWLDDLCYEYRFRYLPKYYNDIFSKLEDVYIDCKARIEEIAREMDREENYMRQMSYKW